MDVIEYATYLDVLSERLEKSGIFLTSLSDTINTKFFTEEEKELSEFYLSFVYSKGIKVAESGVGGLFGGLYRIKTTGDGSCLFHAVGQAIFGPYYKDELGIELSKAVSQNYTLADFNYLYNGIEASTLFFGMLEEAEEKSKCKNIVDRIQIGLILSTSPYLLEKIEESDLTQEDKDICFGVMLKCWDKTRKDLGNKSVWADTYTIGLIEQHLGMNILVYVNNLKKFVKNGEWISNANCVLVFNDKDTHYETIRIVGRDTSIITYEEAKKLI